MDFQQLLKKRILEHGDTEQFQKKVEEAAKRTGVSAAKKRRYEKDPEKHRKYGRNYYKKNRKKILKDKRDAYAKLTPQEKELKVKRKKNWIEKNPGKPHEYYLKAQEKLKQDPEKYNEVKERKARRNRERYAAMTPEERKAFNKRNSPKERAKRKKNDA